MSSQRPERATVVAPSNIAFIKYWGARDLAATVPANRSISMTLSQCVTRTTVALGGSEDEIRMLRDGELAAAPPAFAERVLGHLDNLRRVAGYDGAFQVATENSFPSAAGIASSASGFAALTLAGAGALGLDLSVPELSVLARRSGSGSAARSVLGGYVEWPIGEGEAGNHAGPLAPAEHWSLCDVIALVASGPKKVSSLDGHRRAPSSPYFARRLELLPGRLERVRQAIAHRDLSTLGPVLEEEAIDLHLIAMSSDPAILYWQPGTLEVLHAVRALRAEGIGAWATMDAGPNVHVLCGPEDEPAVAERLAALPAVEGVLRDRVGAGPHRDAEPLF